MKRAGQFSLGVLITLLVACGGDDDGAGGDDDSADADASVDQVDANDGAAKRVFVTSLLWGATLDNDVHGVAGGDLACSNFATAAALEGSWKAWISVSGTNAIDRMADVGPWVLLDGTVVFESRAAMTSAPLHHIDMDEDGATVGLSAVFTGTSADGIATGHDCDGWTSDTGETDMTIGFTTEDMDRWTAHSAPEPCTTPARLYCFEQ